MRSGNPQSKHDYTLGLFKINKLSLLSFDHWTNHTGDYKRGMTTIYRINSQNSRNYNRGQGE